MTLESQASCTCDRSPQPVICKTQEVFYLEVFYFTWLTATQPPKCNIVCLVVRILLVLCMLPADSVPGSQLWAQVVEDLWWGHRRAQLGGVLCVSPHQCVAWRQGPWGAGCPAGGKRGRSGNSGAGMKASQMACTYWQREGEKDVIFHLMKCWNWYFSIQLLQLLYRQSDGQLYCFLFYSGKVQFSWKYNSL